jgi:hypothetical protein
MKPGVIILNCARGEIVKTDDIADALESGRVRGYGTDVLDEEPPRADHPLTKLPNCVVTPHVGSRTHESVQRQAMAAVTNLIRAMHGEQPLPQQSDRAGSTGGIGGASMAAADAEARDIADRTKRLSGAAPAQCGRTGAEVSPRPAVTV